MIHSELKTWQRHPGRFCGDGVAVESGALIVVDAAGHDETAEFIRGFSLEVLRKFAAMGPFSPEAFAQINARLGARMPNDRFTCVTIADSRNACIFNMGNPAPAHIQHGMPPERLPATGMPLGIIDEFEPPEPVFVDPCGFIVVATDGLMDAGDCGDRFGDARFNQALAEAAHRGSCPLACIRDRFETWGGDLVDDTTVALIPWPGSSVAEVPRKVAV